MRRKLDAQIEAEVQYRGFGFFKASFLPIFLLLYKEGNTTVNIAERCGVTKQATSKLVLEMIELGLLKTQVNKEDRRSSIVLLSAKGKRMATEVRKCLHRLSENYKTLMGKDEYDKMMGHLEVLWILHE
ncbi:MAG: MarR family winged helix-turn-helix transcriptional regulator [Bacteroidia bacterium]